MHLCENLGTRAPSVKTLTEWSRLRDYLKRNLYDKGLNTIGLWLSIKKDTKGDFRDFHTGQRLENYTLPWNMPKDELDRKCAVLVNAKTWAHYVCESTSGRTCMCQSNSGAILNLKGLCPGSAIDQQFHPISNRTDIRRLRIQGLRHNYITYNDKGKTWNIENIHTNLTGTTNASHASFTLGKHNWTITGDDGCNQGKEYTTELKMSGCQEDELIVTTVNV